MSSIETMGLRVESVIPSPYKVETSINSQVIIEFNAELDTSTIIDNILVLKDTNRVFVKGDAIDLSDYEIVSGTVTYKDKTVFFTPSSQLDTKSRYIIYVRQNSIRDIIGRVMMLDYTSYFDTEGAGELQKSNIIEPYNNELITSLNKIVIEDVNSDKYILQISKVKTFEVTIYDKAVDSNIVEEDFGLGDGLYYIRAKAINGDFGETNVVTIRTHKNTTTTDQDIDENYIYEPLSDVEIEHLESYPTSIEVNEKTNTIYMKFSGEIELEDIDVYESELYGSLTDSDDEEKIKEHGEVDGSYVVVYDEVNDESYVFFVPDSL